VAGRSELWTGVIYIIPQEKAFFRTPNPHCPACRAKRMHSAAQILEYHPLAGHGYSPQTGWTGGAQPPKEPNA